MFSKIIVVVFICQSFIVAQSRFLLEAELRTNYSNTSSVPLLTRYTYNSEGDRTDRRVYDGVDSMAELMSRIVYSYDSQKRCSEELLLGGAGDTISIVRYMNGLYGILSVTNLKNDGSVRYKDSLLYSGNKLSEQRRYGSSGVVTFYHRYRYSGDLLSSDSLFEPDGDNFIPTQARIVNHNGNGSVVSEMQWRLSGGKWYQTRTTIMSYTGLNLVAVVTFEADGASKRLIDSLAYGYDGNNNRIREEYFDSDRNKNYGIVFTWRDTQTDIIAHNHSGGSMNVVCKNGHLVFDKPLNGALTIIRVDGCQVFQSNLYMQTSIDVSAKLCSGRYIAVVQGKINKRVPFFVY